MLLGFLDLGDLLLAITLFFASMIVVLKFGERRRESRRKQRLIEAKIRVDSFSCFVENDQTSHV